MRVAMRWPSSAVTGRAASDDDARGVRSMSMAPKPSATGSNDGSRDGVRYTLPSMRVPDAVASDQPTRSCIDACMSGTPMNRPRPSGVTYALEGVSASWPRVPSSLKCGEPYAGVRW